MADRKLSDLYVVFTALNSKIIGLIGPGKVLGRGRGGVGQLRELNLGELIKL